MGIWSRTYVCCAIPLYNSGIYLIMAQFVIISLVTGILSFTAPHIVAVSIPTFAPIIFGLVCIAVTLAQGVGFFGVYKERPNLFKTYARVNAGLVALVLLLGIVFIGVSAGNHKAAVANCLTLFTTQANANGTTTVSSIGGTKFQTASVTTGTTICNIWTWVQLGVMGLLFLIVTLTEAYFLMYQNIYASEQRLDHARYDSVYSTAAEEIRQSGLWESTSLSASAGGRPSNELNRPHYSDSNRSPSVASGLRNEIHQDGGNNEKYSAIGEKYAGDGRFTPPISNYNNNNNNSYPYSDSINGSPNGGSGGRGGEAGIGSGNGTGSSNGFYSILQPQPSPRRQASNTPSNMNAVPVGGIFNPISNTSNSSQIKNNNNNQQPLSQSQQSNFYPNNPTQLSSAANSKPFPSNFTPQQQQQPASSSPMAAMYAGSDPYGGTTSNTNSSTALNSSSGRRTPTNDGGRITPTTRMGTPTRMATPTRLGTPARIGTPDQGGNNYSGGNNNNNNNNNNGGYGDNNNNNNGGYGRVSPSKKALPRQPEGGGYY